MKTDRLATYAAFALLALVFSTGADALPPVDTVTEQLSRFRSATGDVTARGRLTYSTFDRQSVRLTRPWDEPATLRVDGETLVLDWRQDELDIVLRLVGACLSADDLVAASSSLGRTLLEEVHTLSMLGEELVFVVGGSTATFPRILIERDTYRLRRFDFPLPEGVYQVELSDYELASGWFPSRIRVTRDERLLFEMTLNRLERAD